MNLHLHLPSPPHQLPVFALHLVHWLTGLLIVSAEVDAFEVEDSREHEHDDEPNDCALNSGKVTSLTFEMKTANSMPKSTMKNRT